MKRYLVLFILAFSCLASCQNDEKEAEKKPKQENSGGGCAQCKPK
jgi:nitrous oxide reductase accessory protein NosL